jgi:hypothetical protein
LESIIYQLDLVTPGSFPSEASFLKQILQIPAFLINPLGLPHKGHLLYARVENFGFLCAFAIKAFLAKLSSYILLYEKINVTFIKSFMSAVGGNNI